MDLTSPSDELKGSFEPVCFKSSNKDDEDDEEDCIFDPHIRVTQPTIFVKNKKIEIRIMRGNAYMYFIRSGTYKKLNLNNNSILERLKLTEKQIYILKKSLV